MPFPFAAVAGAVLPKLLGGIIGKNDQKKADAKNAAAARAADQLARKRFTRDRGKDRQYASAVKRDDRAYAASQTAADRRYAEGRALDERRYAAEVSAKDRANFIADKAADASAYKADRTAQQLVSNNLAEKQAASRGLDFAKLRDDAVAAGFNPLTAMGFANSYSREVGYNQVGGVYDGRAQAPGSTVAGPGAVIPSQQVASSGYSSSGGGYQSPAPPPMTFASNSFLADALGSGIDTYFNAVEERDQVTYQSIANRVATGQIAREVARHTPRQFGFSTAKVQPYRPSVSYGSPTLRSDVGPNGNPLSRAYPNRPVEVAPVTDTPFFGNIDVGYGNTVPGINPDLDIDGPAAWANGMWLSASGAASWLDGHDGGLNERLYSRLSKAVKKATGPRKSGFREGRGQTSPQSYMKTGSKPVYQYMGKGR